MLMSQPPLLERGVLHVLRQRDTGVVDQNVKLLVAFDHNPHDVFPPRFIGDVLLDEDCITATTPDLVDNERSLANIKIGHNNGGTFLGELEGAGASDSQRSSGYDR